MLEVEPPKAEPSKRKRRRFPFRLRTLMIGVTLFCAVAGGYVGAQMKIAHERNAMLWWIRDHRGSSTTGELLPPPFKTPQRQPPSISWVRQLLGDHAISHIELQPNTDANDVLRIRALFPEADIHARRWDISRRLYVITDFPVDPD